MTSKFEIGLADSIKIRWPRLENRVSKQFSMKYEVVEVKNSSVGLCHLNLLGSVRSMLFVLEYHVGGPWLRDLGQTLSGYDEYLTSWSSSNFLYILYARHYKPQLVYFLPHF